ncbi:MAG: RNA 2',3'-cyclic phosphodiesterase [Gammaproteobacteria bacterium]|nr:RNA 2',3'-cyclic phosphodiesterase [Gammaproteobacteria bacterium]MBV9619923.1 RNA 2',3'-cyclic phosphodiesterase [Gammaproteobacteria bacterium]
MRAHTRRLFFALWPEPAARHALLEACAGPLAAAGGRAVPPENLHATLLFLGAVTPEHAPLASAVAHAAAGAVPAAERALRLELTRLAYWRGAGVLAALGTASPGVLRLAAALRTAAQPHFRLEARPYRAHVTVARHVVRPARLGRIEPVDWRFVAFTLVESRSAPGGSLYSVLETHPLFSL